MCVKAENRMVTYFKNFFFMIFFFLLFYIKTLSTFNCETTNLLCPCRKPVSNAKRSESFNMIDLILPISAYLNFMRQRYQNLMI